MIAPVFRDLSKGNYRIISFYAKQARGKMAAWIIRRGITDPKHLKKFRLTGYRYNAEMSAPNKPVFLRDEPPSAG